MLYRERREGFLLALEHIQSIYNRLYQRDKLGKHCENCPLIFEIEKLLEYVKERRFEELEREIGYYLG